MGSNIVQRLMRDGHRCAAFDVAPETVAGLRAEGATGVASLAELAAVLDPPRNVWVMVPAGAPTEEAVRGLAEVLAPGDVVIDGGNTYYRDDIRRAAALGDKGIAYVDCGTSGGVFGLERGFCLMIGCDDDAVWDRLEPVFRSLAPASRPHPGPRGPPASRRCRSRATCAGADRWAPGTS
jgi:6-phosphogluconate dehydrogenase